MKKQSDDTPTAQITGVKRFAIHDGPGIRTTFFLKGCPLKCLWCHNPEAISPSPQMACYSHRCVNCGVCVQICPQQAHVMDGGGHSFKHERCIACGKCEETCQGGAMKLYGTSVSMEDTLAIALEDEMFYRESGGGVTISGGEPLFQSTFTLAFMAALKAKGIHTALDTCLFVSKTDLEKALPFADIFLVDFKHPDSAQHQKLTGKPNEIICHNLEFLSQSGAKIEIRIPVVPGCNDSEETIRQTGLYLGALNITLVRLLPYHALARSKYAALGLTDTMPDVQSPSREHLRAIANILGQYGLKAVSALD